MEYTARWYFLVRTEPFLLHTYLLANSLMASSPSPTIPNSRPRYLNTASGKRENPEPPTITGIFIGLTASTTDFMAGREKTLFGYVRLSIFLMERPMMSGLNEAMICCTLELISSAKQRSSILTSWPSLRRADAT